MKTTRMSLSEFRMKINTALLKRIGAGEEIFTITSHGFPIAQVTAIDQEKMALSESTPSNRTLVKWARSGNNPPPQTWYDEDGNPFEIGSTTNTAPNVTVISTSNAIPMADLEANAVKSATDEDAADIKAALETEHEDTVSSEQAKKEFGLDIPSKESLDRRYENNLKNLSLEMLEAALATTEVEDIKGRAMMMTYIREHRPFTATETEIYRQLMDQLKPDISGKYDGT